MIYPMEATDPEAVKVAEMVLGAYLDAGDHELASADLSSDTIEAVTADIASTVAESWNTGYDEGYEAAAEDAQDTIREDGYREGWSAMLAILTDGPDDSDRPDLVAEAANMIEDMSHFSALAELLVNIANGMDCQTALARVPSATLWALT